MKNEEKRIFISELPETASKEEIEKTFQDYGVIKSVEIKERKQVGPQNNSLYFAYVNIHIDDSSLQKCFKDFASNKWLGQYVQLQLARESFLDRLKREREENQNKNQNDTHTNGEIKKIEHINKVEKLNGFTKSTATKRKISSEESSDTEGEEIPAKKNEIPSLKVPIIQNKDNVINNDDIKIVVKNNRGKSLDKNGLKIDSVGNKPIIKIEKKDNKQVNSSEANLKRLQSLQDMKNSYKNKKSLIKAALSSVDSKPKNKIIFDEQEEISLRKNNTADTESGSKQLLFDGEESEEEFVTNFEVKEQFEGKKGQKLMQLQSKFQNDKRFTMDKRFLEDGNAEEKNDQEVAMDLDEDDEESLKVEKKKELQILEQIIGKKVASKPVEAKDQERKKVMLRFDPSQPDHVNYEVKTTGVKKKKKKIEEIEKESLSEKKREEPQEPKVSKEVFYKVTDDLKDTFQEKQQFSLLGAFGRQNIEEDDKDDGEQQSKTLPNNLDPSKNPFRYDSTDDEDEIEDIPHKNDEQEAMAVQQNAPIANASRTAFWSEPFFFKNDDFRLQEGFDFIEKMKLEQKEFTKLRRDVKEIVKAKVRNNERKTRMFKKKLGGNKNRRKKHIRIKKALKR